MPYFIRQKLLTQEGLLLFPAKNVIVGIGFGLALTPTVMVMESIFYFYPDVRDIATGVALSGTGNAYRYIAFVIHED